MFWFFFSAVVVAVCTGIYLMDPFETRSMMKRLSVIEQEIVDRKEKS